MEALGLRSPAVRVVVAGLVFAGVVACAQGGATEISLAGGTDGTQPAGPPAPSTTLPSGSSGGSGSGSGGGGGGGEDSGASSSGSSGSSTSSTSSSSSSSSSSGGTDGGSSGGTDAGVDAAKIDAGGTCVTVAPSNTCGLAPQCGCAPNQTCDVTNTTTGAVSCVLAGGGSLGSYCTATTQCAKGFTCGYNACRPACATTGVACTGAGLGTCAQYYDPALGTPVPNGKVCAVTCDPRSPSAACGSNNCIFDETVKATDCDKSGTKALYAACSRYNECAQGLGCVDHPIYGYECETWCRIGQNDCGLFENCVDVYGAYAPTSGAVKLGHCQ